MNSRYSILSVAYSYFIEKKYAVANHYYDKFQKKHPRLADLVSINKKIVAKRINKKTSNYSIMLEGKINYRPLISIIIPVFNSGLNLKNCLDSVVNQTVKELEIICIDDGSADNSLDILFEFARFDSRITVVSQENKYAGVARNVGIELATGEYFLFLDSDDFFERNLCEKLYMSAINTGSDIVVCDVNLYDEKANSISKPAWSLKHSMIPHSGVFEPTKIKYNIFNFTNNWVWNKLINSKLIKDNNIRFQKIRHTNDLYFMCMCLVLAKTISVVKDRLVNYRVNVEKSLTSGSIRNDSSYDAIVCLDAIKSSLEEFHLLNDYFHSFRSLCVQQIFWNINKLDTKERKQLFIEKVIERGFWGIDVDLTEDFFVDRVTFDRYNSLVSLFSSDDRVVIKIRNMSKKCKIVSFDIFDTLVFRSFSNPSDLFLKLEVAYNVPDFCNLRVEAEKRARKNCRQKEITIDDIYLFLPRDFQFLKKIEVDAEMETVFSNNFLKKIFNDLINQGKEVILASDMYLKECDIIEILDKCDIKKYKKLYLSSTYGKTKKSGELFEEIVKENDILSGELLHIGDNSCSDFDIPRTLGIASILYKKNCDSIELNYINNFFTSPKDDKHYLGESILSQLIRCNYQANSNRFWFNLGYNFCGPLAYSIVAYLDRQIKTKKPDCLLFIARDGFILQKIYKLMSSNCLPNYYVYASRGMIKNIKNDSKLYDEYVNYITSVIEENFDQKKFFVIDTTTINFTAQSFLKDVFYTSDIYGVYWLASAGYVGGSYSSIFIRPHISEKINFFVETLLSAPTPPVNTLYKGCPLFEVPSDEEQQRCEIFKEIADGALAFASQLALDHNLRDFKIPIAPESVVKLVSTYLKNCTPEDYFMLSKLSHTGDLFNKESASISLHIDKLRKNLISIVVCIYNGEKYLYECLDSIKRQSLVDIEIICVDDCSTDKTLSIINEYCINDSRFKCIKNSSNQGLASSRNKALSIASGEYIQFLDADDYLASNACESIYRRCKQLDLDMLSFSGFNFDDQGIHENKYWSFGYLPQDWKRTWFTFSDCKSFVTKMAVSSCLTVYRSSFLKRHAIRFPDGLFYEDNFFFCNAILNAKRISIHKGKFYARRIHSESITQNWDKYFADYISVAELVLNFLCHKKVENDTIEQYKNHFYATINFFMKKFSKPVRQKYSTRVTVFLRKFNISSSLYS